MFEPKKKQKEVNEKIMSENLIELIQDAKKIGKIYALYNDPEATVRIYDQASCYIDFDELEFTFDDDCDFAIQPDYDVVEEGDMDSPTWKALGELQDLLNASIEFIFALKYKCKKCGEKEYFTWSKQEFDFYHNTGQFCSCGAIMTRKTLNPESAEKHLNEFREEDQEIIKNALQL